MNWEVAVMSQLVEIVTSQEDQMFTWKGFEEHVILQVCEQSIPLAQDTTQNNTDAYGYAVGDCLNSAYRQVSTKSTQVACFPAT